MKKWLLTILAAALIASGSIIPVLAKSSADFADLKDLDAATKAKFDAMINAGIFDGVSDTTFGLKDEMNRAQFAKVAALIFGLQVDANVKTSSFSDVKADDAANGYALPFIEAVKKAGITNGVGDGKFNPAGTVTKEQLATFFVRGLGVEDKVSSTPGLNDSTVSDWAKGYVALALELKLLQGNADGQFGGKTNATRDLLVMGAYEAKAVLRLKHRRRQRRRQPQWYRHRQRQPRRQPRQAHLYRPQRQQALLFRLRRRRARRFRRQQALLYGHQQEPQ